MKATRQSIGRAVDQPDPNRRFYLFHGPDEAQSRALGQRLLEGLGAAKSTLTASALKSDPAALADEAGAMSLFGGKKLIWVEPAGDDITPAVEALMQGAAPESAVLAIGGALRKSSSLLKLAEASPHALAHVSYTPEGQDAERMVIDVGRRFGLRVDPGLAARVADRCNNDQAIVSRELEKMALYLDASPNAPKPLDQAAIDAVGAESAEGDFARLADLALSGNVPELLGELERLPPGGNEAIPVVRSLQRRLLMLAPARARMELGQSLDAVMTSFGKALFWKDKGLVGKMLSSWDSSGLARVSERAGELERNLLFSPAPGVEALGEELIAIALQARRR